VSLAKGQWAQLVPFKNVENLVVQNFTIVLISNLEYEESSPPHSSLEELQKYWFDRCNFGTRFCKQLMDSRMQGLSIVTNQHIYQVSPYLSKLKF